MSEPVLDCEVEPMTHRPSGRMCCSCYRAGEDCSDLEFKTMPVIGVDPDGMKKVRCTAYLKE